MTKREKLIDICFVLDATISMKDCFSTVIDGINDIAISSEINYRVGKFQYGAVIYRDPVDYKIPPLSNPPSTEMQYQIDLMENLYDISITKQYNYDPNAYIENKREKSSYYDQKAFPFNENVAIDFSDNIEDLIINLMKVECGGGNDDPEDWVGAFHLALDDLSWRDGKKFIVWIADSNAHGKPFCGYDNHNEETSKLESLTSRMAEMNINFIGINVTKNKDDGCMKTFQKLKEIYQRHVSGNGRFLIENFKPPENDLEDIYFPSRLVDCILNTTVMSSKMKIKTFVDDGPI